MFSNIVINITMWVFLTLLIVVVAVAVDRKKNRDEIVIEDREQESRREFLRAMRNEKRLIAVNEYLVSMARMIAHDMRQPTVTITNYATEIETEMGSEEPNSEEILRMIYAVSASAAAIDRMLKQLSRYNDIVTSELSFSTPMSATIRDAKFILSDLLSDPVVTLVEEDLKESKVDTVMTRVWQNLIENAIKHNNSFSKVISIGYDNGRHAYFVKDNGIGLDASSSESVFKMFSRYSDKPGSGIGLSSVKSIVNLHGGQVWYEQNDIGGTTFYFTVINGNGNDRKNAYSRR